MTKVLKIVIKILAFSPLKVGFLFLNSKVKGSSKT